MCYIYISLCICYYILVPNASCGICHPRKFVQQSAATPANYLPPKVPKVAIDARQRQRAPGKHI